MLKNNCLVLILFNFVIWITNANTRYDDYVPKIYDTTERHELPNCLDPGNDRLCDALCSGTILCIERKECVCIPKITKLFSYGYLGYLPKDGNLDDLKELIPGLIPRPALRHHIAHFCPNLDVARVCIRKCMKLGKPAFCGKDHVCYCGHKGKTKDKKVDPKAVYKQFKDLYTKYFGPQDSREFFVQE